MDVKHRMRAPGQADGSRRIWHGYALALVGAALFSTKAVFIKLAYREGIDTIELLALRMLIALPLYVGIGIAVYYRRQGRGDLPHLTNPLVLRVIGVGMLGYYGASYADFLALHYISAQLERLTLFTYPFFVVLIGAAFFGGQLKPSLFAAMAISYAGLAVMFFEGISTFGTKSAIGLALVLLASVMFAVYLLLAKNLLAAIGSRLFTCIAMTGACAAVVIHFLLTHSFAELPISGRILALAMALAVLSTVLPSFLVSEAVARLGPARNAVVGNISPLVTTLLAVLVLGEPFTVWYAVGTLCVIVGVVLFGRASGNGP